MPAEYTLFPPVRGLLDNAVAFLDQSFSEQMGTFTLFFAAMHGWAVGELIEICVQLKRRGWSVFLWHAPHANIPAIWVDLKRPAVDV